MTEQKNTSTESLQRIEFGHQSVQERIKHFGDFTIALTDGEIIGSLCAVCIAARRFARQVVRCTTVLWTSIDWFVTASGARPGSV